MVEDGDGRWGPCYWCLCFYTRECFQTMKQSLSGSARCATEACWAHLPGGDLGAAAWGPVRGGLGTCHGSHTLLSLTDPSGMQGELCLSFRSSWSIGRELTHRLQPRGPAPCTALGFGHAQILPSFSKCPYLRPSGTWASIIDGLL